MYICVRKLNVVQYCSRHSSEPQPVVHVVSSREQDWTEQEVSVESSPTITYQEVSGGESQSATSTIKALLELQQTTGEPLCQRKAAVVNCKQWGRGICITCTHAGYSRKSSGEIFQPKNCPHAFCRPTLSFDSLSKADLRRRSCRSHKKDKKC